jgi:hypothetical protein
MILNPDRRGRTAGGRYTSQPLTEFDPNDFSPESRYWQYRAQNIQQDLLRILGEADYVAFSLDAWPDESLADYTWRDLAEQGSAALCLARTGERDLKKLVAAAWCSQHSTEGGGKA